MENLSERVLNAVHARKLVRTADLKEMHIPTVVLTRLVRSGALVRIGRGTYARPGQESPFSGSLAEVASRCPQGIVCLLSALNFHEIGTQSPWEIWIAVPNKAYVPKIDYPPLRVVRFSGKALTEGIETHIVDGVEVRITSIARTVADCFKYRNKIGLDVALEALRDSWRSKKATMDELWKYASVCRVANVMRPYLESLS
jgi:predicted transcriptional regulator of viral defense system